MGVRIERPMPVRLYVFCGLICCIGAMQASDVTRLDSQETFDGFGEITNRSSVDQRLDQLMEDLLRPRPSLAVRVSQLSAEVEIYGLVTANGNQTNFHQWSPSHLTRLENAALRLAHICASLGQADEAEYFLSVINNINAHRNH